MKGWPLSGRLISRWSSYDPSTYLIESVKPA
jgi:hypothetical protein